MRIHNDGHFASVRGAQFSQRARRGLCSRRGRRIMPHRELSQLRGRRLLHLRNATLSTPLEINERDLVAHFVPSALVCDRRRGGGSGFARTSLLVARSELFYCGGVRAAQLLHVGDVLCANTLQLHHRGFRLFGTPRRVICIDGCRRGWCRARLRLADVDTAVAIYVHGAPRLCGRQRRCRRRERTSVDVDDPPCPSKSLDPALPRGARRRAQHLRAATVQVVNDCKAKDLLPRRLVDARRGVDAYDCVANGVDTPVAAAIRSIIHGAITAQCKMLRSPSLQDRALTREHARADRLVGCRGRRRQQLRLRRARDWNQARVRRHVCDSNATVAIHVHLPRRGNARRRRRLELSLRL